MRVSASQLGAIALFVAIGLWAEVSAALPSAQTVEYTSGELTFALKVPTKAIDGDPRTFCSIDVKVPGATNAFASGDSVLIEVYRDDSFWTSDSLVFSSTFTLTSQEVSSQTFDRTVDCTGDFGTEGNSSVSIYGFVDADKGSLWEPDRGASDYVTVTVEAETDADDDSASSAQQLSSGVTDKIAADEDWYAVSVSGTSVALTLSYDSGSGELDFLLTDSGGSTVATGVKNAEGAVINKSGLTAGTYKVKVAPTDENDPNYYDLKSSTSSSGGGETCTGSGSESRDCGNCGTQSRTCTDGTWSAWDSCSDEGDCAPGDTDAEACGTNKSRELTCNDSCEWEQGDCVEGGTGGDGENDGKVGQSCEDDEPCGELQCIGNSEEDGMFYGGYCTMTGCNADSACGDSEALCGGLFDETYCLSRCTDASDCRTGYVCARFGNAKACAPRCRDDDDCRDSELPVCDDDSGLCLSSADADASAWNGERPNADGTTSSSALTQDSGGCSSTASNSWLLVIAAMLVIARVTARRVAARGRTSLQ